MSENLNEVQERLTQVLMMPNFYNLNEATEYYYSGGELTISKEKYEALRSVCVSLASLLLEKEKKLVELTEAVKGEKESEN